MANLSNANGPPVQNTFEDDIDLLKYECGVCGDMFAHDEGIFPCPEHFYCNNCTIEVVDRSLRNINEFPASCCGLSREGIFPFQFQSLLDEESMELYFLKLEELQAPPKERVYCANYTCAAFLSREKYNLTEDCTEVGVCMCKTVTCISCKADWRPGHMCPCYDYTFTKPEWLPEYSAKSRIKQCPDCRQWIELSEACNHMTCVLCEYQFCFICLLPWVTQHEADGCPIYGDPSEGYDKHCYERTPRGLHLYTGEDFQGCDRRGVDRFGRYADGTIAPSELEAMTTDEISVLDYGWGETAEAAQFEEAYETNSNSSYDQNELNGDIGDFGDGYMSREEYVEANLP